MFPKDPEHEDYRKELNRLARDIASTLETLANEDNTEIDGLSDAADVLQEKYHLTGDVIGRGDITVVKANDLDLERPVAIKVLREKQATNTFKNSIKQGLKYQATLI